MDHGSIRSPGYFRDKVSLSYLIKPILPPLCANAKTRRAANSGAVGLAIPRSGGRIFSSVGSKFGSGR